MINTNYLEKVAYEKLAANVITSLIKHVGKPIAGAMSRLPQAMIASTLGGYFKSIGAASKVPQVIGKVMQGESPLPILKNGLTKGLNNINFSKHINVPRNINTIGKVNVPPKMNTRYTIGTKVENLGKAFDLSNEANLFSDSATTITNNIINNITRNLNPKNFKITPSKGIISDSLTGAELSLKGHVEPYTETIRRYIGNTARENTIASNRFKAKYKLQLPNKNSTAANDPIIKDMVKKNIDTMRMVPKGQPVLPMWKRLPQKMSEQDMFASYKTMKKHNLTDKMFDQGYNGIETFSIDNPFIKTKLGPVMAKLKVPFNGSIGNDNLAKGIILGDTPRIFLPKRG